MKHWFSRLKTLWQSRCTDLSLRMALIGDALHFSRPIHKSLAVLKLQALMQDEAQRQKNLLALSSKSSLDLSLLEAGLEKPLSMELELAVLASPELKEMVETTMCDERRQQLAADVEQALSQFVMPRVTPNLVDGDFSGCSDEERDKYIKSRRDDMFATAKQLLVLMELLQIQFDKSYSLSAFAEYRKLAKDRVDWWDTLVKILPYERKTVSLHVANNGERWGIRIGYENSTCCYIWLDDENALLTPREIEMLAGIGFRYHCGEWAYTYNPYKKTSKRDYRSRGLEGIHYVFRDVCIQSSASQWARLTKAAEERSSQIIAEEASREEWQLMQMKS